MDTPEKQLRAIAREFIEAIQDQNFDLAAKIIEANPPDKYEWSQYVKEYA